MEISNYDTQIRAFGWMLEDNTYDHENSARKKGFNSNHYKLGGVMGIRETVVKRKRVSSF